MPKESQGEPRSYEYGDPRGETGRYWAKQADKYDRYSGLRIDDDC